MKTKITICILVFGFLTAVILSSNKEIQNKKDITIGTQSFNIPFEKEEAINLFIYVPVEPFSFHQQAR